MRILLLSLITLLAAVGESRGQDDQSAPVKLAGIPQRFFSKVSHKMAALDDAIDHRTQRYVRNLIKQESQLRQRYFQLDSNAAKSLFLSDPEKKYTAFLTKIRSDSGKDARLKGEYLPYADSLQGSLAFINQNPGLSTGQSGAKAGAALQQMQGLEARMNNEEQLRQYIQQRKEQIRQFMSVQCHMPKDISAMYGQYNVQLYYYSQQLQEYKNMLNDPDKMMRTVLQILNKVPTFSSFMKNNSFLSGVTGPTDDYNMGNAVGAMQTRDITDQLIQSQINGGGPNAASAFSQSLQSAQGQLGQLKDKLHALGAGSADADLPPGFKPNNEKAKTFFQRLEYGMNIQNAQSTNYFPSTSDIGLSVGYKLNDKNIIGLGASYKTGWGQGIKHIKFTSQGLGLRSFIDLGIKEGWYATGGLEYNYQQPFTSPSVLKRLDNWQRSGLIGITKAVSVNTKYFKKMKVQLLWDFLSYQQLPKAQPIKFRVGYNF